MDHYHMLPALHESGLVKAPQVLLLGLLTTNNEGTSHAELMTRVGLPAAHVSTCLTALEKAWLVERRYPLRDGRTINIYLTAPGTRRAEVMLAALRGQKVAVATGMQET
jgi:DNA-binding MarR family transcriptional regulator